MVHRRLSAPHLYARAAIMWAMAGGILFVPCALILMAQAWHLERGWTFPALVMLGVVSTYAGAYLYFSGGAALMHGRPGWQLRLTLAPWFTWNLLLGLSLLHLWDVGRALFVPGVLPPPFGAFLDVCAALHVAGNALFLATYPLMLGAARAPQTAEAM
jgi:hypothetical protein